MKDDLSTPPLMLVLESSGNSASACVLEKGVLRAHFRHDAKYGHAQTLVGLTEQAIRQAGCAFSDVTHIAAGCGPGSFTGLRVCLATAKGYVLATGASAIGVNGLAALNFAQHTDTGTMASMDNKHLYVACIDSRRGSLFVQHANHQAVACSAIMDIPDSDFDQHLDALCRQHQDHDIFISCAERPDKIAEGIKAKDQIKIFTHQMDARIIAHYASHALSDKAYVMDDLNPIYVVRPKLGSMVADIQ